MDSTIVNSITSLPIDKVMIALVLLSGFLQKRFAKTLSGAWKTLMLSLLLCSMYAGIYYIQHEAIKDMLTKWFFSYVLATSLYELLMKRIIKNFFADEQIV